MVFRLFLFSFGTVVSVPPLTRQIAYEALKTPERSEYETEVLVEIALDLFYTSDQGSPTPDNIRSKMQIFLSNEEQEVEDGQEYTIYEGRKLRLPVDWMDYHWEFLDKRARGYQQPDNVYYLTSKNPDQSLGDFMLDTNGGNFSWKRKGAAWGVVPVDTYYAATLYLCLTHSPPIVSRKGQTTLVTLSHVLPDHVKDRALKVLFELANFGKAVIYWHQSNIGNRPLVDFGHLKTSIVITATDYNNGAEESRTVEFLYYRKEAVGNSSRDSYVIYYLHNHEYVVLEYVLQGENYFIDTLSMYNDFRTNVIKELIKQKYDRHTVGHFQLKLGIDFTLTGTSYNSFNFYMAPIGQIQKKRRIIYIQAKNDSNEFFFLREFRGLQLCRKGENNETTTNIFGELVDFHRNIFHITEDMLVRQAKGSSSFPDACIQNLQKNYKATFDGVEAKGVIVQADATPA